jgi:hypothetical protein
VPNCRKPNDEQKPLDCYFLRGAMTFQRVIFYDFSIKNSRPCMFYRGAMTFQRVIFLTFQNVIFRKVPFCSRSRGGFAPFRFTKRVLKGQKTSPRSTQCMFYRGATGFPTSPFCDASTTESSENGVFHLFPRVFRPNSILKMLSKTQKEAPRSTPVHVL